MKTLIKVLMLLLFFITLISCNKETLPTPIEPEKEIEPGSRDYVWDETVLEIPAGESALLRSIWGASTNDIWAVGDASLSQLGIWHFNGTTWKNVNSTSTCGQLAIWGTSTNNVWLSNISGILWHFNGEKWEEPLQLKVDGYSWLVLQSIWGTSENEIYSVGFASPYYGAESGMIGIIFKYDGKKWTQLQIISSELHFLEIRKTINGNLVFYVWNEKAGELSFYTYDGNELKKLFVTDGMLSALERIGDQLFFSKDQVIYEYKDKSYQVWKDFTSSEYYGTIFCYRSVKDIFTRTTDGKGIGHYNGSDFKVIHTVEGSRFLILTGIAFEKDVYFLIQDYTTMKTRILHGKLKDQED
jgi:hypothetical protein